MNSTETIGPLTSLGPIRAQAPASPIPARAWVKSAGASVASNDEWNRDAWTKSAQNISVPSAAAEPAEFLRVVPRSATRGSQECYV